MERIGSEEAQQALVQKILASEEFRNAPKLRQLLTYLSKHKGRVVHWKDVARDVQAIDVEKNFSNDGSSSRHLCTKLRRKLAVYADRRVVEGDWRCLLPLGVPTDGFRLVFDRKGGLAAVFWQPHTSSGKDVAVVYNEVLFFHDTARSLVFRYWDMEDQLSPPANLAALKAQHPDEFGESVRTNRLYVFGAEINARDAISDWFRQHATVKVTGKVSRKVGFHDLDGMSQILLGNRRTSELIREIFTSEDCAYLGYSHREAAFGLTEILSPTDQERKHLLKQGDAATVVGRDAIVLRDSSRMAFGLVTRIPHPRGDGDLTMISSSFTRVVERIARTLTDDREFEKMLRSRKYTPRDQPIPAKFQALMSVALPPAGSDGPAGEAKLICWRIYGADGKPA